MAAETPQPAQARPVASALRDKNQLLMMVAMPRPAVVVEKQP